LHIEKERGSDEEHHEKEKERENMEVGHVPELREVINVCNII